MTRNMTFAILRVAITLPLAIFAMLHRSTKVDAACYTGCDVQCSGPHSCSAQCLQTGGMGSYECNPIYQGTSSAQCEFEDSNCFS
jgi:hypothetical protein